MVWALLIGRLKMIYFFASTLIAFALLTNLHAAAPQPEEFSTKHSITTQDVRSLRENLGRIFHNDVKVKKILDKSIQEILALGQMSEESLAREIARIAYQTAQNLLPHNVNIEELRAATQNPILLRFIDTLFDRQEMFIVNSKYHCANTKYHCTLIRSLYISCILMLLIALILIEYSLQTAHTQTECSSHRLIQDCPCYEFHDAVITMQAGHSNGGLSNLKLMGECMSHIIFELLAGHKCSCI
jgi:hypothetical protein